MRHALRVCRRQPAFALAVVLTFALGIGANTAVFTIVHGVLLRPLPFEGPDRVLVLGEAAPAMETTFVSPVTYDDWATRNEVFSHLAAFRYWETVNLEDGGAEPVPVNHVTSTATYFDAIGVRPYIGRTFKEEQKPGGGSEAVLSHAFWMRRYRGDPGVLGTSVRLRGHAVTIVGVMPPLDADLSIGWGDVWTCWYRYNIQQQRATAYRSRYLTVIGRLKPDVTFDQAMERMTTLQHRLWTESSSVAAGYEVTLRTLTDALTGRVRTPLVVLLVAVAVVLLTACANVANLMLARAAARQNETIVRVALGAGRLDLIRLLLTESLCLAGFGGVAGIGLAWLTLAGLRHLQPAIPRLADIAMSPLALVYTLGATVLVGVLASLAPVVAVSRTDLQGRLRQGGRGGGSASPRVRRALVAGQTAMACLLLIAGGLLLRSFGNLLRVDPGFTAARAIVFDLFLPANRYPDAKAQRTFYRELLRRLGETPGVQAAGGLLYFPFKPKLWLASIAIERDPRPPGEEPVVYFNEIAGDYFAAMAIPLKAGRLPSPEEMWDAPRVVVINEAMARQMFPGRDPIGARMAASGGEAWLEVVGVVGDVRQRRLDEPARPEYYTTFASMPMPFFSIVTRTRGDATATIDDVRRVVREMDPGLAAANLRPLDAYVATVARERRFAVTVLGAFALIALVLGGVGIHGVMSYAVARRRREMGIRLALGASPGGVRRLIVREGVVLAGTGTALGLLLALPAAHLLQPLLFGVQALDPITFLVVPLLLAAVSVAATWWPAHHAAGTEALTAMRDE